MKAMLLEVLTLLKEIFGVLGSLEDVATSRFPEGRSTALTISACV